jgi:hypothetical protein
MVRVAVKISACKCGFLADFSDDQNIHKKKGIAYFYFHCEQDGRS